MTRFDEVTEKVNKMFKSGNAVEKDILVGNLKLWVKQNRTTDDKDKLHAINSFLADKGIV